MTDLRLIHVGDWAGFERRSIPASGGKLSVRIGGPHTAPTVLLGHSILTSSAIWHRQAMLLVAEGYRVVCLDTRGHGASQAPPPPYAMDDLVDDAIAVLDVLDVARAHYVGVSQGGMTGFGLGVKHRERLESLCIVAARADAPPPFAAAWDDRITLVRDRGSIEDLAGPTADRWFGTAFLAAYPTIAADILTCIRETSADGFVGCAQAIQGLDYLNRIATIAVPTMLVIGTHDTLLLQPMRDLAPLIAGAELIEIAGAGHLPQIDRPAEFEAALSGHLAKASTAAG